MLLQRIWAHVKENGLQNPKNKREFQCDEVFVENDHEPGGVLIHALFLSRLFNVFGTKKIDGFKMVRLLLSLGAL